MRLLGQYDFPGNVRELANTIERAVIVSTRKEITLDDLPRPIQFSVGVKQRLEQPPALAQVEAEYVKQVLEGAKGNKTEAARILGISRKNLYEKLARFKSKDEGPVKDEG